MTTLLDHAKAIADEIGVIRPSKLINSSDITSRRLLAIAKAAGHDLHRAHDWSVLHREYEFTTTAGENNYAVPDDWHKARSDTAWDRDQFWQMRGNRTPQEWQFFKSGLVQVSIRRRYRLLVGPLAGSILIQPTPTATGETLVIEYLSRFWCESSGGTGQADWQADTDVIRLDTELFRLGFLWRAKRSFSPPYADEHFDYVRALRDAIKSDINMPTFSVARPHHVWPVNVPEGSWPTS